MEHFLILALSLLAVIQSANLAAKYAEKLAESFKLSRHVVGFIIVSLISILPEAMIAINAAFHGQPSFGVGTIFGSNVADLTLIFALITFVAGRKGLRVEKTLAKKLLAYPLFLAIPLILGLDGSYTRAEGLTMLVVGLIFYIYVFNKSINISGRRDPDSKYRWRNTGILLVSLALLLVGAYFSVESATDLARLIGVSPVLIGILIIGLGTTIPEGMFAYKAVRNRKTSLAVGDIMGTVLADATVVIGLVSVIQPFDFPARIAYIAGAFMVLSSIMLVIFIKTNYQIRRREAIVLILAWLAYILAEIFVSDLPVMALFQ